MTVGNASTSASLHPHLRSWLQGSPLAARKSIAAVSAGLLRALTAVSSTSQVLICCCLDAAAILEQPVHASCGRTVVPTCNNESLCSLRLHTLAMFVCSVFSVAR
ncbi:hypothetical protein ABBQ38_007581 [Trebouxia sp. C0009 RCD-2024]